MTLNGKLSKDKYPYRKGGFCPYCNITVTSWQHHNRTYKHIKNYWDSIDNGIVE